MRLSGDRVTLWNRKLHYYLGLYFLFFLWLFSLSGLLLNHPWNFTQFFPNREVKNWEAPIRSPGDASDIAQARDLMQQLGIQGEVTWNTPRTDPARLEFNAVRPGHIYQVQADWNAGRAKVMLTEFNGWGILRTLHTFVGVSPDDPRNQRDWVLTIVWALAMDALAAGVVFMVCSGIYIWWGVREKRRAGLIAIALGVAVCGWFAFGLRWLYG